MQIAPNKVAKIIILARESDRGEAEFDAFIQRLTEEEQAELVALFWVGRGSFEVEEWDEAVQTASASASSPTEDYLKGSPHLADHLEAGLEALGIDSSEVEDDLYRSG